MPDDSVTLNRLAGHLPTAMQVTLERLHFKRAILNGRFIRGFRRVALMATNWPDEIHA
jgi:hypothetical protein